MAATTKLLQLRPKTFPTTTLTTTKTTNPTPTLTHFFFSSSTTPDPTSSPSPQDNPATPPPQPAQSQSLSSSYFRDLKASLKQQQQQRSPQSQTQPQTPRKPFSFASSRPNQSNPPSGVASLEEIRRNLSEFRHRSAAPPPPPTSSASSTSDSPSQHVSFQEIYQRTLISKGEESSPDASKASGKLSFDAIRESLRRLHLSPSKNQGQGGGGTNNHVPLSGMRTLDPSLNSSPRKVLGGSNDLPLSIFGEEIKKKAEGDGSRDPKLRTEFVRMYTTEELGEKLRALRPEKRDTKDWFSLEELNERLLKLREMEEKESGSNFLGRVFRDLREGLQTLNKDDSLKTPSKFETCFICGM